MSVLGKTYIYVLRDPQTDLVFYVGKSNRPTKRRGWNSRVSARLATILETTGKVVAPEVVEVVEASRWKERESYWIDLYKRCHFELLNQNGGGVGCHEHSFATIAFLRENSRGRFFSKERRRKIGLASARYHLGRRPSKATRNALSDALIGRKKAPFSVEHRQHLREAHLGQEVSEERRRIASLTHKGKKVSKETREKLRNASLKHWADPVYREIVTGSLRSAARRRKSCD